MAKNWAIAIGINHYNNLPPLEYAQRDAQSMENFFRQEAGFEEVFLFTKDSPAIPTSTVPIPTQPTYGEVRRFLRSQFEEPLLEPGDNLWFFFSGHGLRYDNHDYLLLSDTDPGDVEYTALSINYITQRLRRSGADNVVLLLDACRNQGSKGEGIGGEQQQGYDMHGNVWEWCADHWHSNYEGAPIDGSAWLSGNSNSLKRMLRGGFVVSLSLVLSQCLFEPLRA